MTIEELQEQHLQLQTKHDEQVKLNETTKQDLEKANARITELQTLNQQLYTRITTPAQQSIPQSEQITIDDINKKLKEEM